VRPAGPWVLRAQQPKVQDSHSAIGDKRATGDKQLTWGKDRKNSNEINDL
jgi:hypothetical protein